MGTVKQWKHWCPHGCGRKVVAYKKGIHHYDYICKICGKIMTKEELL